MKIDLFTLISGAVLFTAVFSSHAATNGGIKPFIQQQVTEQTQIDAAAGIIKRITPGIAGRFNLEIIPAADGKDVFEIESLKPGMITLRGNNGVSLAGAYNHYLKNYCRCMVLWCGNQLNIPSPLPQVTSKIRIICPHIHRVYFNYCTLNYTASWWHWDRWEHEIDIMAMNGINMPLSVIGLEGVWYYTLLEYGFSDKEAREFLVGPTYFAWQWMTNIQSHGGPLPKEWIDARIELGRKILERQRALGMNPIQQGFTGYVPRLLKEKYPDANIVSEGRWCGFEGTAQLDPLDPLFAKLGTSFLQTEKRLLGTSHVYAADPFHEGHPPRPGNEYLKKVGKAIYNLINNVDPGFTWAMQSWSIREPIACAVPKDQLLVLDLAGHRKDFWGYDYVKGQLHNFGGRINLHGDIAGVVSNPFAATAKSRPACKGMGLFMEGIEQNPVFYEAVFDMIWRDSGVNVNDWLKDYALRRYGKQSDKADAAWQLLLHGPYKRGTSGVEKSSIIAARPALRVKKSGPNAGLGIPYNPASLVKAWQLLLDDADNLKSSEGYRFDVADIGRQVLSNLGQEIHKEAAAAFTAKDRELFKERSEQFLKLMQDVDRLLATTTTHNFGKWVADARDWGSSEESKRYYEWNASMLVTIWGPEDNPGIFDYSWREWSGLINLYYVPRWQMFYDHLDSILAAGGSYTDPKKQSYGRESLRANDFYSKLADWEIAWIKAHHEMSSAPRGDAVKICQKLLAEYEPVFNWYYSAEAAAKKRAAENKADNEKFKHLGTIIDSWNPEMVSTTWGEISTDISKSIDDAGTYEILFLYTRGGKRLDMKWVALFANGEEVCRDTHKGTTGNDNINNIYYLPLKDFAFNTKYTIKAMVRSDGGNTSYGKIILNKK